MHANLTKRMAAVLSVVPGRLTVSTVLMVLTVLMGLLMMPGPLLAHHGTNISYDHSKPITFKGKITEFRFANPHAQVFFDVVDEKGVVQHWSGELTNPSNLVKNGWTRKRSETELQAGSTFTITVFPSKSGTTTGVVSKILNEKGEQILLGREQRIE